MTTPEHATAAPSTSAVPWQDVEELLHEIAELAKSPGAADDFAVTVCRQTRRMLAAEGVAIWIRNTRGAWSLTAESASPEHGAPQRQAPGETLGEQKALVAAFAIGTGREGAVEVRDHRAGTNHVPADVIEAIAELVGDFYRGQRIEELGDGELHWRQFVELLARVHASLDLDASAYRIANEGRTWLGADRVSVLMTKTSKMRLTAMSGVDRVDRRADLVGTLERLAESVTATNDFLWYEGESSSLSPEIEDRLHQFLEHSPAKTLAVVPLRSPPTTAATSHMRRAAACLVVENFEQLSDVAPLRERLHLLAPHAASSLANARQHGKIPWAGWIDRLDGVDRHWWLTRTGIAAAVMGAVALALAVIPADFKIEARGELQPKNRREVFAPADGVIAEVRVEHGQDVGREAVLLRLTQSQLDLERARISGELQTARKKLAATQALKLEPDRSRKDSVERNHQLTADEEELKELIKSLQKQQEILELQQSELTVHSPLAGKVLTWNVEPLLSARPVARGQHLMSVADLSGPWELDLRVADDRMGHVLAAQQDRDQPLAVTFVVATDPGKVCHTHIDRIAQAAESDEHATPTVTVTATIDPQTVSMPRPGSEVIAHIDCGRRSIGYVWFHDLVDAVRSWLWF